MLFASFIQFLLKYIDIGAAGIILTLGINLVVATGSSSSGFCFLGIITIIIGVIIILISCLLTFSDCTENIDNVVLKLVCCDLPLTLLVASLGIFALVVSKHGEAEILPGRSYKEYHFESYSKWMQHKISDDNWNNYYKNDVVKEYVCSKMIYDYSFDSLDAFHKRSLDSFQSSCCKPPEDCKFNYTRPTIWVKPQENDNYTNSDCNQWDNDVHTLCFNCNSCKAAFLEHVTHQYYLAGAGLLALGLKYIIPFVCLMIGCCVSICN